MDDKTRVVTELRTWFQTVPSVLVCFSGGVDSALVLAAAHEALGGKAVGMTAVSPSLPDAERLAAVAIAKQIGARHELVQTFELEREDYRKNDIDRCFHCKSELYEVSEKKRAEWDIALVVNGVNTDDLGDHRPGLEAAKRAGVRSPLVELGMSKADVRNAAQALGLSIWDKPASACLSSRLPYGTMVTRERLAQVGGLEAELRQLGLRQLRVRLHPLGAMSETTRETNLARIEVAESELPRAFELRERIVNLGKAHGFSYVTLDLAGYRMGSHNEVIVGRSLRIVT